ncbi:hypothetical protein F4777DRAFT_343034 [Nemania sp. FL0916]|nr:hypothetical protein F4777DRAFT_343034 [Nemania sp. FL0916]
MNANPSTDLETLAKRVDTDQAPKQVPPVLAEEKQMLGSSIRLQEQNLALLQILVELQQREPIATNTFYPSHNTLLQLVGLIFAVLFGIFSICAWQVANTSNELTTTANDFANDGNCVARSSQLVDLVSFCTSNEGLGLESCKSLTSGRTLEPEASTVIEAVISRAVSAAKSCNISSSNSLRPSLSNSTFHKQVPL